MGSNFLIVSENSNIFKGHVNTTKAFQKKTGMLFSSKDKMTPKKQWLDKFAFYKIGTLLGSSLITDPIKAWQTNCLVNWQTNCL